LVRTTKEEGVVGPVNRTSTTCGHREGGEGGEGEGGEATKKGAVDYE
jgi:hypothetical protein